MTSHYSTSQGQIHWPLAFWKQPERTELLKENTRGHSSALNYGGDEVYVLVALVGDRVLRAQPFYARLILL